MGVEGLYMQEWGCKFSAQMNKVVESVIKIHAEYAGIWLYSNILSIER